MPLKGTGKFAKNYNSWGILNKPFSPQALKCRKDQVTYVREDKKLPTLICPKQMGFFMSLPIEAHPLVLKKFFYI